MKLRNFSLGINSYPASSPGSNHTTARDVLNLRVDGDGYLRLASAAVNWLEFPVKITGIARAHDHLFYACVEDGDLYVMEDDNETLPTLVASTEMRGRLSVIDEFETFFLLTSEGADDPGYYYDVESGDLTPLNFLDTAVRPTSPVRLTFSIGEDLAYGDHDDAIIRGTEFRIYYLFVEYDADHQIGAIGSPVSAQGWFLSAQIRHDDDDDNSFTVKFNGFSVQNSNATHIRVYRALFFAGDREFQNPTDGTWYDLDYDVEGASFSHNAGFGQVDDLTLDDFALIKEIETDGLTSLTVFEDDAIEAGESLRQLHIVSGLPDNTKKWVHFNGRNFLAGDNAMKFSDAQFGVLLHTVFRASNSINAPGTTDFVEALEETLVFGDATHLHVMRGYDPSNYQVYQVASVGPVSPYAGAVMPNGGLGFIGAKGFHYFDGEQVKEISSPQLDRFFEGRHAVDGAVLPLPNAESLWCVDFEGGTQQTFLLNTQRFEAPVWTRLSAVFDQGSSFPLPSLGTWSFADDGQWTFGDGESWAYTDPREQPIQRIFLVRDVDAVEEYLWYDLNSGERVSLNWSWESNLIRGETETVKVWDRLKLAGHAENDINVDFALDIEGETVAKSVEELSFARNSRKKRIPIKRRANALSFVVEGYGDVELREVELDSRVVGRV